MRGSQPIRTAVQYIGAQINFGDLTPFLTFENKRCAFFKNSSKRLKREKKIELTVEKHIILIGLKSPKKCSPQSPAVRFGMGITQLYATEQHSTGYSFHRILNKLCCLGTKIERGETLHMDHHASEEDDDTVYVWVNFGMASLYVLKVLSSEMDSAEIRLIR